MYQSALILQILHREQTEVIMSIIKKPVAVIVVSLFTVFLGLLTMSCSLNEIKEAESENNLEIVEEPEHTQKTEIVQEEIIVDLTGVEAFTFFRFQGIIDDPFQNRYLHPHLIKVENLGIVDNRQTAIESARFLWGEIYGNSSSYDENLPVHVFYNRNEDCWLIINGDTVEMEYNGGLPDKSRVPIGYFQQIIVRTNGDIIAMWHDSVMIVCDEDHPGCYPK